MKVFFVLAPAGSQFKWAQQVPPLGISSIGANLSENCHEVFLYDASLDSSIEPTIEQITKFKPEIVGISFTTLQAKNAVTIANSIKSLNKDIIVIAGGVHATPLARPFLSHCDSFDIIVRGEGEHTMLDLVDTMENSGQLKDVKGITFRDNNKIIENEPRPLINDMDSIPFASKMFHSFDLNNYSPFEDLPLAYQKNKIRVPLMTTRGCPFRCTFCYCPTMWGRSYRKRSPMNVVDEIEYMISEYSVSYIRFYDDNFCVSEKHVLGICKEIKERGLDFEWRCEARVGPTPLNKKMLTEMRGAGCHMVELGVESGSQNIINSIKKQITIPMVKNAFKLCQEVGLNTKAFIISGLPGEGIIDTMKTMKLLSQIKPNSINLGTCQILPETAIYQELSRKGIINEEMWFNYDNINIPRYYEFIAPFQKYLLLMRREILSRYCKIKGFL